MGGRAEPTGISTAGTPALVRLLSSAQLPPAGECARPTVRGCGWGEGERDHLRPEPLRGEGERRERGEGRARCLLLRATAAGAPTSSPAAPSAAKGYCRTTSLPHPPLRPGLCGRRQPRRVWAGLGLGLGLAGAHRGGGGRDSVSLSAAGSAALRRPLPPQSLFGVTGKHSSGPLLVLSMAVLFSPLVPQLPGPRPPRVWPTATATVVVAAAAATRRVLPAAPPPPSQGCGVRAGGWAPPGGRVDGGWQRGRGAGHVPTGGWARTVGRPATVLGSQCPVTGSRLSRLSRRSRESG